MKAMRLIFLAISLMACTSLFSQTTNNLQTPTSVNEDGTAPDGSAMFHVQSVEKGILTPRMATAQRTAITTPADGLLVYDTDRGSFWFFENNAWNELATATPPGESGANPSGGNIPDNDPTGITSIITLTDPGTVATETRFRVCLDISHSQTGDLDISLEAPDGTSIDLSSDNGSSGDDYTGTCFTTEATNSITGGVTPFTGNWQPEEPFSDFVGKTIAGDWKLKVVDDDNSVNSIGGQLNQWSIQLSQPSATTTLLSDADGDTRVAVEDLPDEDIVRLEAGENSNRLEVRNDISVFSKRVRVFGNFESGDESNTAFSLYAFAGGGSGNNAQGTYSFVGGGVGNTASGLRSFVGGGDENTTSGFNAFVGGGTSNTASGDESFIGSGEGLTAKSHCEAVFGTFNTDYSPNSTFAFNGSDRIFVIGNGTSNASRSNALTVLKNGNIGIGEESPGFPLTFESVTEPKISLFTSGADIYGFGVSSIQANYHVPGFASHVFYGGGTNGDGSELMRIRGDGNVGIGTNTPNSKLEVAGVVTSTNPGTSPDGSEISFNSPGGEVGVIMRRGDGMGGVDQRWDLKVDSDNSFRIRGQNFFDWLTISTTGNVGLGRVPLTNDLEVEGTASKSSAGNWAANSDARLKKNIRPLESEEILQKMLSLRGITYEWDDDQTGSERPEGTMYGFTAQNIQAVFPELVTEDNLGFLQTAYGTYDAMTVEAMRALHQEIESGKLSEGLLLERMEILEAENAALKSQLSEMEELKNRLVKIEAVLSRKINTDIENLSED